MTRSLLFLAAAACLLSDAATADAHHSHPYFYDQCQTVSIVGRVERVEWKDPHSIVVVTPDDGGSYTIDWNSLTALTRDGVIGPAKQAVVSGARIVIAGNPIRPVAQIRAHFPDFTSTVNPRTIDPTSIRRADDSWSWAIRQNPNAKPPDCGGK